GRPATGRRRVVSGRANQHPVTGGHHRGTEGVARGGRAGLPQDAQQLAKRRARRADHVDDPGVGHRAAITGRADQERVALDGERRAQLLGNRRRCSSRPQGQGEIEERRRRGRKGGGGRAGRRRRGGCDEGDGRRGDGERGGGGGARGGGGGGRRGAEGERGGGQGERGDGGGGRRGGEQGERRGEEGQRGDGQGERRGAEGERGDGQR